MATYDDLDTTDPHEIGREIRTNVKHCRVVVRQYRRQLLALTMGGRPERPLTQTKTEPSRQA